MLSTKQKNNIAHVGTYLSASDKICPKCGSHRIQNITRITGYLSLEERFGSGKVAEKKDVVCHTNPNHQKVYHTFK